MSFVFVLMCHVLQVKVVILCIIVLNYCIHMVPETLLNEPILNQLFDVSVMHLIEQQLC